MKKHDLLNSEETAKHESTVSISMEASTPSPITKSDLLENAAIYTAKGHIKIKPLTQLLETGITLENINNVFLHTSNRVSELPKNIIFGNNSWRSLKPDSRHLTFSQNDELTYQLKMYALLKNTHGNTVGGKPLEYSTLQNDITYLNKFAKAYRDKGLASFHQSERLSEIKLRDLVRHTLVEVIALSNIDIKHNLSKLYRENESYGLFLPRTSKMFEEEYKSLMEPILKGQAHKAYQSHPIIPQNILKKILSYARTAIKDAEEKIDTWERLNRLFIKRVKEKIPNVNHSSISEIMSSSASPNWEHYEELVTLHHHMEHLKVAVYIYILAFTGVRESEALACKVDSAFKTDDGYSLTTILTKTDNTEVELDWFANKEVFDAVNLLSRYTKSMHERARLILALAPKYPKLKKSRLHNLKKGLEENRLFGVSNSYSSISFANKGRFAKFHEYPNDLYGNTLQITITREDISELERVNANYKEIKGKERGIPYKEGDFFRLTAHMFRHTLAYFVIANKLGELEDIRYQYKHLTALMTFVYTQRGYKSSEELIEDTDGYTEALIDAVTQDLIDQAQKNELKGQAGVQINKAAQNLVIGVTSGGNTLKSPKQVHFKDLNEFKKFLVKNLKNLRGLPHGYCTAGESCKIKNRVTPSGCVYCSSYMVSQRQKVHWEAMRNHALNKLKKFDSLSPEKQQEVELFKILWNETLDAANLILNVKNDTPNQEAKS